jgi:hypothetical protein
MKMRFAGMTPASQGKTLRRWAIPGAGALGAPSAWLFLVRVHACRAGLRFTRRMQFRSAWLAEQTSVQGDLP